MNPHLDRAVLLIQQNRHELAEKELRQVLAAVRSASKWRSNTFGKTLEGRKGALKVARNVLEPFLV